MKESSYFSHLFLPKINMALSVSQTTQRKFMEGKKDLIYHIGLKYLELYLNCTRSKTSWNFNHEIKSLSVCTFKKITAHLLILITIFF